MSNVGQPVGGAITPGNVTDRNIVTSTDGKYTIAETREIQQKFGEPPVHVRKFKATQEFAFGQTTQLAAIAAIVNVQKNAPHPAYPGARCTDYSLVESIETTNSGKKLVTEITATYTIPDEEDPDAHPLAKPDTWTFQTQGSAISALYYYDGNTKKPLVNSAGDYIKGLQLDEAQTKVIIKGNRANFPAAIATAITNCVNDGAFLGAGSDQWKCMGIGGALKYDTVNQQIVKYWEVTVELMYRQTGWNLLIPDVGFNFIADGQKRRAMVFDDENKEWVASAEPVALNGNGGLVAPGGQPAILDRRVYRRVNFGSYFGSPPS